MSNQFAALARDANPSPSFFAVTPSDATNFSRPTRALYVGGAGDVVAVGLDGVAVTFVGVTVGTVLPIMCSRVNSTSTTATSIVGLV